MATIKVFSADGVQELKCFDTLDDVPYSPVDSIDESLDDEDEVVDF